MLTLILILVFLLVIAGTWYMGLWSNLLTVVCVTFSGLIATNYFEVIADLLEESLGTYTYLLDFLCLWGLFFISFAILRITTDLLSRYRVKFDIWVEMIGRSVLSIWIAWIFLCFTCFTLHTAPLPLDSFSSGFQQAPDDRTLLVGPDRMWLALMQSRSRGALSRGRFSDQPLHADDEGKNVEPFDPLGDFIFRYHHRRESLSERETLRVDRGKKK